MKWIDIVTRKQNILLIYTKLYGWCEKMKEVLGIGFNHMLMVSRQEATTYYVYKSELAKLLRILMVKILKDKPGKQSLAQVGIKRFQNVINYLKIVTKKDLGKSSNKQLASYFKNYFERQIKSLPFLVLPTFVDDIFVEEIQNYLEKKLKISSDEKTRKVSEYINIFTTLEEESYATKAERELLEIALKLLKEKNIVANVKNIKKFIESIRRNREIYKKLVHHTQKWEWLPIQAEEKPYNINFFITELQKLAESPNKIKTRLLELDEHIETIKTRKAELFETLKINQSYKRLISVFQEWVYLKDFRRAIISQERLYSRPLYVEIGKRLNLTGREVRFLSPGELVSALNKEADLPSKEEINNRMKAFVLIRHDQEIQLLTSEEAKKVIQKELPPVKISDDKILKGTSPGKAIGKVKIILGAEDVPKIQKGDILVARQTTPDLIEAMRKSAAIITDEGGLLCHAAIVAREMNKPCIIGTKIATKVLKDGDLVEVDANNGIVKILKRAKK